MWGDPRPANRTGPFRGSQEERFAPGWNRDYPPPLKSHAQERHSGNFPGRDSLPFDFQGHTGPPNPPFANVEDHSFSYGARDGPHADYRVGEGPGRDFMGGDFPSDFQNRDSQQLDFRGREIHPGDFRDREGPPMDYRGGDGTSMDYRGREASHMNYRDREAHAVDFRGRDGPPPDFRGRGTYDLDFRGRDGSHSDFRGRDISDLDFRGRDQSHSDFRNRDMPDLDFRGKDGSQMDFRGRSSGTADLDFRDRDTPPSDFRGRHRSRTDQDFRGREMAPHMEFTDREMPPMDPNILDFIQPSTQDRERSGINVNKREESTHELAGTERPPFGVQKGEFQHSETRAREGDSHGLGLENESPLDFRNNQRPLQDQDKTPQIFANKQPLSGGEQRSDSGLVFKEEVGLDFLGRQDTDYRNMEYRDVDHRVPGNQMFDYSHSKSFPEGKIVKDSRQDLQDQDYRTGPTEEKPSRLIRLGGVPENATKEDILNAFRTSDGTPVKDLQLKDYSSGEIQYLHVHPPEVWVCGHTVVLPEKRVWCQPYGTQLGIAPNRARVSWLGTREMLWDQLLPLIQSVVQQGILPNVIVIHLGGNDLVQQTSLGLIITMKNDLTTLCRTFPKAKIVWSALLPRRIWPGAQKPGAVDKARKALIKELSKFCSLCGISVLRHDQIVYSSPELFSQDGVHLSEIGEVIFNANLREAIEACL